MAGTMRDPAEQIVLEGPPPGSGRPSWLALLVAAAIALGSGVAIGYGVRGSPNAAPAHGRSLQHLWATCQPAAVPDARGRVRW
jgi:hypothetical protein